VPVEAKPLFRPDVLRPYLAAFTLPERVQAHRAALARWAELFASGQADQFKEHELLHNFLTEIFCGLLAYTRLVDNNERYTFSREKYVEVDGKYSDAVIGEFQPSSERFVAAIWGKACTPLFYPKRKAYLSAIHGACVVVEMARAVLVQARQRLEDGWPQT